jgi:hypothetical protein
MSDEPSDNVRRINEELQAVGKRIKDLRDRQSLAVAELQAQIDELRAENERLNQQAGLEQPLNDAGTTDEQIAQLREITEQIRALNKQGATGG